MTYDEALELVVRCAEEWCEDRKYYDSYLLTSLAMYRRQVLDAIEIINARGAKDDVSNSS